MNSGRAMSETVSGNSGFEIPAGEIPGLEKDALAGGAQSAYRLSVYYGLSQNNNEKQLYWLTIAAENGSPAGEYNLGFELAHLGGLQNTVRAIFWLKRAKRDGEPLAEGYLKELGEVSK
jgi:TPR repeat protein